MLKLLVLILTILLGIYIWLPIETTTMAMTIYAQSNECNAMTVVYTDRAQKDQSVTQTQPVWFKNSAAFEKFTVTLPAHLSSLRLFTCDRQAATIIQKIDFKYENRTYNQPLSELTCNFCVISFKPSQITIDTQTIYPQLVFSNLNRLSTRLKIPFNYLNLEIKRVVLWIMIGLFGINLLSLIAGSSHRWNLLFAILMTGLATPIILKYYPFAKNLFPPPAIISSKIVSYAQFYREPVYGDSILVFGSLLIPSGLIAGWWWFEKKVTHRGLKND